MKAYVELERLEIEENIILTFVIHYRKRGRDYFKHPVSDIVIDTDNSNKVFPQKIALLVTCFFSFVVQLL